MFKQIFYNYKGQPCTIYYEKECKRWDLNGQLICHFGFDIRGDTYKDFFIGWFPSGKKQIEWISELSAEERILFNTCPDWNPKNVLEKYEYFSEPLMMPGKYHLWKEDGTFFATAVMILIRPNTGFYQIKLISQLPL